MRRNGRQFLPLGLRLDGSACVCRGGLYFEPSSVVHRCMTKVPPFPISIRLDADTERRLRRLAHETGGTLSSIVREAVAEYGAAHDRQTTAGTRPYDRLQHLLGVVSNRTNRSEHTGEQVRSILKAKLRARRAR